MIKAIKSGVMKLVGDEYDRANLIHTAYHSDHEAFAVLMEEVCELVEEVETIKGHMRDQWELIRLNETYSLIIKNIKTNAIYAACEAVQVAAVCERWGDIKRNTKEERT